MEIFFLHCSSFHLLFPFSECFLPLLGPFAESQSGQIFFILFFVTERILGFFLLRNFLSYISPFHSLLWLSQT